MTTERLPDGPTALPGDHHVNPRDEAKLKAGAVGLTGVLFMAAANAAPITAMSFNVPIAIGYGNGTGASAGFLFATVILTIFTVGFVSMARHITTTGAFYGFISQGLGQVPGMASGLLAAAAYCIFEGSLIGGFAYFASDALSSSLGITLNWLPIAIVGIVVITLLTYFSITLAASILSVTLVTEVLLLLALGISVLIKGGPDGLSAGNPFNLANGFANLPANAYGTGVAAGTAAVGIFFAFWSWIGYETTAVYGEESKEPRKIVPRATLILVVALGLFYTFMSWMVVAGQGNANAVKLAAGASPVDLWITLVQSNLGTVPVGLYKILVVVGSFACAMAFHNAASRYIYAMGREAAWPAVRNTLGRVNIKHGSPATASFVQSGITLVLVLLFMMFTHVYVPDANGGAPVDTPALVPYVNIYGILALIGTAMILLVQAFTSFAVISYFWVKKTHTGNWFTTLVCPLIGAAGMLYVVFLLWQNRAFAAGLASDSNIMTDMPYIIIGLIVVGFGYALWVKSAKPEIYAEIGQTTLEEAHERV
jgi:amino acid transporter